jgi:hypothetical protein
MLWVSLLCNIFNTAQFAPLPFQDIVPDVPQQIGKHQEACWVSMPVLFRNCIAIGHEDQEPLFCTP